MATQSALSLPYPVPHNEEERLAELCARAGLSEVRRLDVEDPFNALYTARP